MPASGALKPNHVFRSSPDGERDVGRPWRAPAVSSDVVVWVTMSILLLVAAVLFVRETRGTTLSFDEWTWALHRRGSSLATFLTPHNGHLSLVPIVIYKILFATAGLGDYAPYRALVIGAHLCCVALVFVYAKRRASGFVALSAAALILFLGPAWQNFLWPFQIAWLISIGTGLGALLLLDRHDRRGNAGACALCACSLASSGIGLAVAVGLAVDVLSRSDRRRRAWIVLAPLALYAIWWIVYQNTGLQSHAIALAPGFIATVASATFAALVGLAGQTVPFGSGTLLVFGPPLALMATLALGWHLLRQREHASPRILALLAITVSFWLLAAAGRANLAQAYDSRYLYVGGIFIVALGAELLGGVRVSLRAGLIAAPILLAALAANIGVFSSVGRYERAEAQLTAADLGALDIGRPVIPSGYQAADFPGFGVLVDAKSYFETERAIGSPAASVPEIESYPDGVRKEADSELIAIHRVGLMASGPGAAPAERPTTNAVLGGTLRAAGTCLTFTPDAFKVGVAATELQMSLPPGGLRISVEGGAATVAVRRFSQQFQPIGSIAPGASADLSISRDLARGPWQVQIAPDSRATVCGL